MDRKDIKNLTIDELKRDIGKIHASSYRAEQILYWIYKKGVSDFNGMNNIPARLKEKLTELYYITNVTLKEHIKSTDGTEKFLFGLLDGHFIESVLIYANNRKTICLSTQVGCRYRCAFCASGLRGFIRNLSVSEILDQILFLQHTLGHRITNFVFMGMGEPMDNYENLINSIMIMNSPQALNIGARRITVSTCGIIPGIEKFIHLGLQVRLSVSLHAVDNKLRDSLMPVNRIYPLEKLISSCGHFIEKSGRKITFEYLLIKDKNDSLEDARRLSSIARRLKAKINLIAYNPIFSKKFKRPSKSDMNTFKDILIKNRVKVTMRESKGKDIQAACGQLAMRLKTLKNTF